MAKGACPMAEPTKAYYVDEALRGSQRVIVFANSAAEAEHVARYGQVECEAFEPRIEFAGIRSVRRAPGEDRNA
jgi:hypothetical protein